MELDESHNSFFDLQLELENKELSDEEKTEKLYNFFNDYINSNLSVKNNPKGNLDELKKLSSFYNGDYNTKLYELLLRNNTILSNIILSVITSNFNNIKTNKIIEIVNSKFILALIDFYQASHPKTMKTIELLFEVCDEDKNNTKVELGNEELSDEEKTEKLYNFFNDYINSNLSVKNDSKSNLDELKKLSSFYNGNSNTKLYELLLRNNTILSSLIRSVIISNFNNLKTEKITDIIDSKFILALIDFYQALYPKEMETIDLFLKFSNGDKMARSKLISNNIRIVYNIANKYATSGEDVADLVSEGMTELMRAIDSFELSKNIEFSTYALRNVEGCIKNFIDVKNQKTPFSFNRLVKKTPKQ